MTTPTRFYFWQVPANAAAPADGMDALDLLDGERKATGAEALADPAVEAQRLVIEAMLTEQTAFMPLYGAVLALQRVGRTWLLEVPENLRQRMQNILMQNSPRRGLSLYDESADLFVMHDWRRLARFAPGSSPVRSSGAPQAECAMPAPEEALATVVNEFGPFLASRGFTEVKLPANGSVGRHFVRRFAAHSLRLSFEVYGTGPLTLGLDLGVQVPALTQWKARISGQTVDAAVQQRHSNFFINLSRWLDEPAKAFALLATDEARISWSYLLLRPIEVQHAAEHLHQQARRRLAPMLQAASSLAGLEALLNRPTLRDSPFYEGPAYCGQQIALARLLEKPDWADIAQETEREVLALPPSPSNFGAQLRAQTRQAFDLFVSRTRVAVPFDATERRLARKVEWIDAEG
jgi:hypothetical protein